MTFSIEAARCASTCALFGALVGLWSLPARAVDGDAVNDSQIIYRVLHRFAGTDGINPSGELVQSTDGNLYGVTGGGGAAGGGAFYRVAVDGSVTVLHDFGGPGDGASPRGAPLETSESLLYGTTYGGGTFGAGTVYRLVVGGSYTVLHTFTKDEGGWGPEAGLIEGRDGNLYGTTAYGGKYGGGTLFGLTPDGLFRVLHNFDGLEDGSGDGANPAAALIQASDGSLYGTTSSGVGFTGNGVIFRLTPSGDYALLHWWGSGSGPTGPLIQAVDGNFYGTTGAGSGSDCGTVYRMTPDGVFATVHIFHLDGIDGCVPASGLLEAGDGYLYGTTTFGGAPLDACTIGCGTVYRMSFDGEATVIHDFDGRKGDSPGTGLTRTVNRRLVGTTTDAFTGRDGTVFGLGERPRP